MNLFNKSGPFEWESIAAIAAILAVLISLVQIVTSYIQNSNLLKLQKKLNDENFEGNIVSTARIEWIQEVRKKSVDFIASCYDYFRYVKLHNDKYDDEKIIELKSIIEKSSTLLILYFGPDSGENKNNDFIVYLITTLSEKITNKENWYSTEHILNLEKEVYVLKDFLRIYFKAEWKRANRGLSDEEVQEYLEKNKYYAKIMEIYKVGLICHEEDVDCFYEQIKNDFNK